MDMHFCLGRPDIHSPKVLSGHLKISKSDKTNEYLEFLFILYFHTFYLELSHKKNHFENPSHCHSITGNAKVPPSQVHKCSYYAIRVILIFSQATIRIDNDFTSLSHIPKLGLDHCWGNLPPYLVDVMF